MLLRSYVPLQHSRTLFGKIPTVAVIWPGFHLARVSFGVGSFGKVHSGMKRHLA